jgi:hypothetical protein
VRATGLDAVMRELYREVHFRKRCDVHRDVAAALQECLGRRFSY